MKRHVRFFAEAMIVLIAFGAAGLSQRELIAGLFERKSTLPPAVSFQDVQEEQQQTSVRKVIEQAPLLLPVVPVENETPPEEEVVEPAEVFPLSEEETAGEPPAVLPASINLAVPFTPQAPFANWSEPFKEACEEASLYMVHRYFAGEPEGLISQSKADEDLRTIVAFENELFGFYEDTTVQQIASVAELLYGYERTEILENPTVDDLKAELAAGRPVIVPAAGRLLGNPNFQQPGPLYHMLVLRGYTDGDQFITNDPGTRRGEGYLYGFPTIMDAMHDWTGGENIQDGAKRVFVIYPQ